MWSRQYAFLWSGRCILHSLSKPAYCIWLCIAQPCQLLITVSPITTLPITAVLAVVHYALLYIAHYCITVQA